MEKKLNIISLFSGCGGLDLGFENAGFAVAYANDFDKTIKETFEKNHHVPLDCRSIVDVKSSEIPDADGIIGGPPCQSWSLAGAMRGEKDIRGQLFYEYIRILHDKKPLFFVAENVPGIISSTHLPTFKKILQKFEDEGYEITYKLLDARDYGVPEERKRVIVVGYNKKLGKKFEFPAPTNSQHPKKAPNGKMQKKWLTLKDALSGLPDARSAKEKNKHNFDLPFPNQEYMNGGFSTIYLSRNRRRGWDEASFTIQAGGRHAPLYPGSAKMVKIAEDKFEFVGENPFYRRLSVRECARIQTFPDEFIFYYNNIADGYKMIGNAVPVKLAEAIANAIMEDLKISVKIPSKKKIKNSKHIVL
ncbi:MAG: DNA cytosine methyltransferase [Candidatus Micrarchaeia archaeon]|jgi:DNA (cytosine-5)-methyltransferase 1